MNAKKIIVFIVQIASSSMTIGGDVPVSCWMCWVIHCMYRASWGRVGEMTGYSSIPMIFYYFLISIHIKRSCIKVFINSINHGIILMAHVMQSSNDVLSLSAYEARLGTSTEFMINNGWLTMTRHGPNRSDMISSWSKALDAPNTCGNSS